MPAYTPESGRAILLATCSPFRPGYGFVAHLYVVHLPSGRSVYRLVSWDAHLDGCDLTAINRHFNSDGDRNFAGPTVRAECDVNDYHPHAGSTDADDAAALCSFWASYARDPEGWGREPSDPEQPHTDWWTSWDDYLTGSNDDGSPLEWTCNAEG